MCDRLLKPAPPSSQMKAVRLNISFLQSEFTFKVQSANTMCFRFGFFNCFLVRVSHTSRKCPDVSASHPCFLGWKRKDRNRGVVKSLVSLVRGNDVMFSRCGRGCWGDHWVLGLLTRHSKNI